MRIDDDVLETQTGRGEGPVRTVGTERAGRIVLV